MPTSRSGRRGSPRALVMAPTRELALQVQTVLASLEGAAGLTSVAVYGGASPALQARDLHRGVDIVVGTPGRINDFLERGDLSLERVEVLGACSLARPSARLATARRLSRWLTYALAATVVAARGMAALDEADEMLTPNFLEQIEGMMKMTRKDRQTLLFSATMPPEIRYRCTRHAYAGGCPPSPRSAARPPPGPRG